MADPERLPLEYQNIFGLDAIGALAPLDGHLATVTMNSPRKYCLYIKVGSVEHCGFREGGQMQVRLNGYATHDRIADN